MVVVGDGRGLRSLHDQFVVGDAVVVLDAVHDVRLSEKIIPMEALLSAL